MSSEVAISKRMAIIREEHPDGDYPSPMPGHEPGECIECDALRRLELDDETSSD